MNKWWRNDGSMMIQWLINDDSNPVKRKLRLDAVPFLLNLDVGGFPKVFVNNFRIFTTLRTRLNSPEADIPSERNPVQRKWGLDTVPFIFNLDVGGFPDASLRVCWVFSINGIQRWFDDDSMAVQWRINEASLMVQWWFNDDSMMNKWRFKSGPTKS